MNEYFYTDIQEMDKLAMHFKDGNVINFEDCRLNWANEKKVNYEESFSVAERNIDAEVPYFIFYDQERTKVIFMKSRLPFGSKPHEQFLEMQNNLTGLGYSSYDLS